jgi:hypothetical protein
VIEGKLLIWEQDYKGDTRNSNDLDPQIFEVGPLCFFEFIHDRPVYGLYISAMISIKTN